MAPPSREALSIAIGRILFLRLSKEDARQLFRDAGAAPDWAVVMHYTRQAVTDAGAAATIATLFVNECAVLNAALEPHMYLGVASISIADLACYYALIAAFEAFPDAHKWALCSVSRWFDCMQHEVDALSPPAKLGTARKVAFNLEMPDEPPTIATLPLLVTPVGGATPVELEATPASAPSEPDAPAAGAPASADKQGKSAAREKKEAEKAAKKAKQAAAPPAAAPAPPAAEAAADAPASPFAELDGEVYAALTRVDIRIGQVLEAGPVDGSDKLLQFKVDMGGGVTKQILSGIKKYYDPATLVGNKIVTFFNIKPKGMAGLTTEAMILCASSAKGSETEHVEMLAADAALLAELPAGSKVYVGEPSKGVYFGSAAPLIDGMSKKQKEKAEKGVMADWEKIQPHFQCQRKKAFLQTTRAPLQWTSVTSDGRPVELAAPTLETSPIS